jgi:segregation and condensation protein A
LHLIEQHDLDILDIPIAFVAEKYVEYLMLMQELSIDVASEYLVMAATLAHIKSKLLLPAVPADQDEALAEDELDPRAELIRRLLEYQKYRDAAQHLGARSVLGRDVFARGGPAPQTEGPVPLERLGLFQLLDAFQSVLGRVQTKLDHLVELDRLSITERINQLYDLLRDRGRASFEELFEGQRTRTELIVTFLALLEMTRLNMTSLFQEDVLSPILVELTATAVRPEPDAAGDESGATVASDEVAPPTLVEDPGQPCGSTADERDAEIEDPAPAPRGPGEDSTESA